MANDGIFLGRSDEIRRYEAVLEELGQGLYEGRSSPVVLVYGLGGIGKSSLLNQFRQRADEKDAVAWIDFEEERKLSPASFGGDLGPGLRPVLDITMKRYLEAMDDHNDRVQAEKCFDDYRADVVRLPDLLKTSQAQIAEAGRSGVSPEDIAALTKSTQALIEVHAGIPTAPATAVGAIAAIGGAAVNKIGLLRRLLGTPAHDYELLADPHGSLADTFGRCLAQASQLRPATIFLDTSEIVMTQLPWLRAVMRASGDRVLWVVGARLDASSDTDPGSEINAFVREVPEDRLRRMGLTRFDDPTVGQYLQTRLRAPSTAEEIKQVADFTKGLPLAVSLVTDLLASGVSLEEACAPITRPSDSLTPISPGHVVSTLARRFLLHVERQPGERAQRDLHRILCLAVANGYPTRSPRVLAALWGTDEDLFDALTALASAHDFVLPGNFRLHDDVRDALRDDLIDPVRRRRIEPACSRAVTVLDALLEERRALFPTLRGQLNSNEHQALLLDYIWYSWWANPLRGWQAGLSVLPVLMVTSESAAAALLEQLAWFAERGTDEEAALFADIAMPQRRSSRAPRIGSAGMRRLADVPPTVALLGSPADREAALEVIKVGQMRADSLEPWRQSDLLARLVRLAEAADDALAEPVAEEMMAIALAAAESSDSLDSLTAAAGFAAAAADDLVPQDAWRLQSVAWKLSPNRFPTLMAPAEGLHARALAAAPRDAGILGNYALFLTDIRKDHDQAQDLYKRAINAHPTNTTNLGNYANFLYTIRKDHDRAQDLYKRAINAHPTHAIHLGNYAYFLYTIRKDHDRAQDLYERAINADPTDANHLGNYAYFLHTIRKNHDRAQDLYERAITADPTDAIHLGNYAYFLHTIRKDHDLAQDLYERAITADPTNANNLGNYALFLKNVRKNHDRAQDLYERAINADPTDANHLGNYAYFLQTIRKNHDRAQDLYKRAITADPTHADNLGNYAGFLFVDGKDATATEMALSAVRAATRPEKDPLLAECNFYLFAHAPDHRATAGLALRDLLAEGISTGDWDFTRHIERVTREDPDRAPLLTALAAALGTGDPTGLEDFPEWAALGTQ